MAIHWPYHLLSENNGHLDPVVNTLIAAISIIWPNNCDPWSITLMLKWHKNVSLE